MELVIVQDYHQICTLASTIIKDLLKTKPKAKIALATGNTMLGVYALLIKNKADFSKATFFCLDEYCNAPKNKSMYSFIWDNLYSKKHVKKKRVNFPNGNAKDLEKECREYEKKFLNIDLTLLGIGRNGHIAFNEPNTSFKSKTHITKLTESTIKANKLKSINKAITVGLSTIIKSRKVLLLASGKEKKEAISKMMEKADEKCPASILKRHNDTIVIVDEEAYRR